MIFDLRVEGSGRPADGRGHVEEALVLQVDLVPETTRKRNASVISSGREHAMLQVDLVPETVGKRNTSAVSSVKGQKHATLQ